MTYSPGMIRIAPSIAPRTYNRSFRITAVVDIPEGGAEGALVALGGVTGGWSFSVQDEDVLVFHYNWLIVRPVPDRLHLADPGGGQGHAGGRLRLRRRAASARGRR